MTDCGTCNDRGWVAAYPGDKHGDLCPDCHGDLPEVLLSGPICERCDDRTLTRPEELAS